VYWTERARAVDEAMWAEGGDYRSLRNYVITDLGPELPDNTGLFVWTTQEADPGDYYYAVVGSAPNSNELALWATAGPVTEQAADPAPVLVWQSADGRSGVYTQFMDYANYNPTYDAPNASNYYLGLPEWEMLEQLQNQQYAYNYWVGLPDPAICGGAVPDQAPLVLHIEGWGSRYGIMSLGAEWCVVTIWGDDPNQSWYFGFSATHDYNTGLPVTQGPIVNYTEARLLRAVREVIASVDEPQIDTDRIYVYGHSMGGTGALMMAERYPDIFAAISASEPMMNFAASDEFREELVAKWGTVELNLPVESRGPDAAHLAAYDGTGVWDWENLGAQLSARRGDEMAFVSVAHGTEDRIIDWETVARPAYTHFYEGARGFIGEIVMADHTWAGFRYHNNFQFDAFNFRKDESFPALSNASGSLPTPPGGPGSYNLTLEWSASWYDFAGPPVDEPGVWSVALRSLAGEQTVDVTPRRLQAFAATPGTAYSWRNERLDNGEVVQEGELTADADGLLTVPGFTVTEAGNRLVIEQ
jgi:pimeloyl-ACP methyl ester carboxylesterase